MTQNTTDAKKKFEEKLIEGLSAEGNIDRNINITNSDILSYVLLLNANNNESIDKSITSETLRFNIFKFIKLSDININIMKKYDLYKQIYISDNDIQKLKAILTVLKKSEEIYKSLKKFFDSMDNFTTESKSKDSKLVITDKINKINEIKELSITQITSDYFHYVKDSALLVVGNTDVKNFINYLADEYINEIIEKISYVGTFKSDVKNLIDEIHKEGGDITVKDFIINKIISDAKIKAELINKERLKINDSDDKNIEILLINNKSIFSYNLSDEIRNEFYGDNTTEKQPIFFNKKIKDNTKFFIIFLKKLYRVFIKDNINQDTVKKNNFISYILYRIYYYYLNIVENIKKIDGKYKSKILDNYDDILGNTVNISADTWVDDGQGTSKITVLETVLNKYNTFFDNLTTKIIELLNSYDKDNSFAVTYPIDTADVNKTQYFFTKFKKHIINSISSAESEFGEDVSIDRLSDCIYNYYNITFKYELYDSIYIYKDESLYILYKIYEHKYNIYYNKCYENETLHMKSFVISSENLKEIFIEKKNKQDFKLNINILHGKALALLQSSSQSSRPSSSQSSRPSSPLRRKNSSNTKVAHSDMLGDIVDRNLTEVFDTFKSDNSWSDKNLDREKESLLHIVEENLIDIFDTFKSDKAIRDKVDSSLLDIVEINLIDIFDTFNTRTTSEEKDLTTSESSSSEASSPASTPRNHTKQESTINPQKYEKIINNLENDNMYIFAVDNFADDIQVRYEVRYKVGYRMEDEAKAKAKDMDEDISLRSFNNYIIYIDNANKIIKKFKINRKYNLKYILKIIYKKYDDIIIVSKRDNIKNILYQYKKSNYINIIFIYKKTYGETEISQLENFEKIIDKKNQDKDDSTKLYYNKDYEIILKYFNDKKEAAKQQVKEASAAEITKRLKEGLATQSTGAMIVEKNTFEAPAAPEAAAPTPEAAAPTPEAAAETETVAPTPEAVAPTPEAVAPTPEAVAEITKRLKEGLATLSTGAMIVEKNTLPLPAPAPEQEAEAEAEASTPDAELIMLQQASSVANYHRISNEIINIIFNMLKTNNKALIISETKYSDNNKDEKKNINGVYTLNKDNETPLHYIYTSTTSPDTIIYLTYNLNNLEQKYYISLTIKSDGNIVGYNLEFSLEHFTTLLLKDNKQYSFSDGNISFTINFQDNPNTETEDSLLDIVEGNLSNVFDTLDIKESKITINNPNTKTDDYLLDIVEGNLSNVFDTLNDNTDDDALKLIKFLINYHDINSNVSALNLIQFLINSHKN